MARVVLLVVVLTLAGAPAEARAAEPYPGSNWSEAYFASADGTRLHADVLRPAHLPADARTPVILTVSPYTNHSGQTGPSGQSGPSDRFYDFLGLSKAIERGYTYVMVDLRGFGGSAGCNDWGGPGERMDAKAAVEWAAAQPWSTGRVAVLGKSYDGWTGLMAIAERPRGLAAVVSMEPVYSGYRYLYMDGVRFVNSLSTPVLFSAFDAQPGDPQTDTAEYLVNGTGPNGPCYAANIARQQLDDPDEPFWRERDLIPALKGATTPLFLTQGFLETNTKPDGLAAAWNAMAGPKRAWFGQFDHVRGWETSGGELLTGRPGFIEEVMRFLDHHLRDAPAPADPAVVIQDADGRYRGETAWPPSDATERVLTLRPGDYRDDGENRGSGARAGAGAWSISPPLAHPARLSGEPRVEVEVEGVPRSNLVVNVYDIAPDGQATMISRGAMILRDGAQVAEPEMYGQDWLVAAGHRVGVLLSGANAEWFEHVPTHTDVIVKGGSVRLPFLRLARSSFLDGAATARLRSFLAAAPFKVAAEALGAPAAGFDMPPEAIAPPVAPAALVAAPRPRPRPRPRLRVRAERRGSTVTVRGTAVAGARLRVALRRGRRTLASRRVTVRSAAGVWRVRLRAPRRGPLSVRVSAGRRRVQAVVRSRP